MLRSSTRTALLIVDVQKDFLPGGSLAVPNGDEIIEPLKQAAEDADLVICSRDWHPANHVSFKEWPPHCVQGTPGAKIIASLKRLAKYTISKGDDPEVDAYSAFAGHTLRPERLLRDILDQEGVGKVIVGGLALDVCVKWTALDANFLAFETLVPLDLSRALTKEGQDETVTTLERAGVHVWDHWD